MRLRSATVSPAVRGVGACTGGFLDAVPATVGVFLPAAAGVLVGIAVGGRVFVAVGARRRADCSVGVRVMRRVYRRAVL